MANDNVPTTNAEAHSRLVNRLQRLWQSDPGNYWKEFRASGLQAKDVWPDAYYYVEPERLASVPRKQPGKMSR